MTAEHDALLWALRTGAKAHNADTGIVITDHGCGCCSKVAYGTWFSSGLPPIDALPPLIRDIIMAAAREVVETDA